ncbi:MAG: metalloregulator ArsR/SmtB family transcription factor [Leptolyngbyaceae cyanobacterium bins.302]|nr:metalloregulator ArsR/SmtB family transcription factor [Leptolyngbyaceae cyanobacterium bins.302]
MQTTNLDTLLQFFKALSNESRLKLVGILSQQERSVEELASLLNLKEPTVSHHLTKLKELDLVQMRPQGNSHLYQLKSETLQQLSKVMFTPNQMTALTSEIQTDAWEKKVLSNFLEGDRIKEIPASRKKRLVILKWLVNRFQENVDYPEKMVNAVITQHHPDCATLRRELIGYQMMQRQDGVYRRLPESEWRQGAHDQ